MPVASVRRDGTGSPEPQLPAPYRPWEADIKLAAAVCPSETSPQEPLPCPASLAAASRVWLAPPVRAISPATASAWPPIAAEKGAADKAFNTLFIGSEGVLACGFDKWKLLPEEKFAEFKGPEPALPPSPGFHKEWLAACRGGTPASCNFDYSGPMTESVLLANIAYRIQGEFDWNAAALEASRPDATALLRREYRKGWEV